MEYFYWNVFAICFFLVAAPLSIGLGLLGYPWGFPTLSQAAVFVVSFAIVTLMFDFLIARANRKDSG